MNEGKYLVFKEGDYLLGVNIKELVEIIHIDKVVKVPRSPSGFLGVINYRGEVIPVFSISKKLKNVVIGSKMGIVVNFGGEKFAFNTEEIVDIVSGEMQEIKGSEIFKGVIKSKDKEFYILDLSKFIKGR